MTARPALQKCAVSVRRFLVLACAMIAAGAPTVLHADDGRYSLGAIQPATDLEVVAGVPVATWLGFYNIDGTAPTTVALSIASSPKGWQVTLSTDASPAGADEVTVTLEPSSPSDQPPECAPSTTPFLLSGRGYVCAETAWLRVLVPQGDGTPREGEVTVRAEATWPSQGAFRQERNFVFRVQVAAPARRMHPWFLPALAAAAIALLLALMWRRHIAESHQVD